MRGGRSLIDSDCSACPGYCAGGGGSSTPSITWTIPFDTGIDPMIVASLIITLPSFTWNVTREPFAMPMDCPSLSHFT